MKNCMMLVVMFGVTAVFAGEDYTGRTRNTRNYKEQRKAERRQRKQNKQQSKGPHYAGYGGPRQWNNKNSERCQAARQSGSRATGCKPNGPKKPGRYNSGRKAGCRATRKAYRKRHGRS